MRRAHIFLFLAAITFTGSAAVQAEESVNYEGSAEHFFEMCRTNGEDQSRDDFCEAFFLGVGSALAESCVLMKMSGRDTYALAADFSGSDIRLMRNEFVTRMMNIDFRRQYGGHLAPRAIIIAAMERWPCKVE